MNIYSFIISMLAWSPAKTPCWMHGLTSAIAVLRESQVFADDDLNYNFIIENEKGVDMLRPNRETIGVLAGDQANIDMTNE